MDLGAISNNILQGIRNLGQGFMQGAQNVGNAVSQDIQRMPQIQQFNAVRQAVQTPQFQQNIVKPVQQYIQQTPQRITQTPILPNFGQEFQQNIAQPAREFAQGFTTPATNTNLDRLNANGGFNSYSLGNFLGNDLGGGLGSQIPETGKLFTNIGRGLLNAGIGATTAFAANKLAGKQVSPTDVAIPALGGFVLGSIGGKESPIFTQDQLNIARNIDAEGRSLLGTFAAKVEDSANPNKINMGAAGDYAHSVAETIFGKDAVANLTNTQLKNILDAVQQQAAKKTSGFPRINIGLQTEDIRGGQPSGQKQSSFSNITAPQSNNVGETLASTLKNKNVTYTPQTEQAGLQAASKYAASSLKNKTIEVQNTLAKPVGTITRQEALNAQAVALKLQDSLGNIPVDKMTPAQKQTLDTATNILTKLSEHYTASGQLSQSAAVLRSQTPQGLYYSAIKTLGNIKDNTGASLLDKNPQLQTTLSNLVNDVKGTKVGTPEREMAVQKLVQTVTDQIPRSLGDKAFGIWRAMLISGPETATKVATSYGINLPGQLISRPISAAADTVISHTPGVGFLQRNNPNYTAGERSITFNPSDYGAFGKGAVKGTTAIPLKLKTNLDVPGTSSFNGYDNPAQSMTRSSQQTFIEKPFTRLHASIPKPVYTGTYDMNIAEQARTAAVNAGKAGDQGFIQNLIQNPTNQMKEIARTEAEKATNMASNAATKASSNVQNIPVIGRILNPIAKVPANIGVQGLVDYSPLGYGKAAGQIIQGIAKGTFDQRDFSTAIGKATVGTGIAALGAALMNAGRMSLAQPNDAKERALNEAQNIPNNSVYVGGTVTKDNNGVWQRNGGTWVSLNAAGPLGITLGLGGGTAKGGPVAGVAAGAKLLADQPYVQGVAGFGQALSDPARYANTFLDRTASSIIPGAIAQPATGTDTIQRMPAKNIQEALTSKIPGLRETLAPQRNIFGQTLPGANPQGTVLGGILGSINPLYPQQSMNANDPAVSELQRLYNANGSSGAPAISQPMVNQTILGQKVKLNSQQLSDYIGKSGPQIRQDLTTLVQSPSYQALTDAQKTNSINSVLTQDRAITKNNTNLTGTNSVSLPTSTPNKIPLPTSSGGLEYIDVSQYSKIPTTATAKAIQDNNRFTDAEKVLRSSLPDAQKQQIYQKIGVDPKDVAYYDNASQSNDIKSTFVQEQLSNFQGSHQDMLNQLVQWRKDVAGKQLLTSGVITDLVNNGTISKQEGSLLNNITYKKDLSGQYQIKQTGRVSGGASIAKAPVSSAGIQVKFAKLPQIKLAAPGKIATPNVSFKTQFSPSGKIPTVPNFASKVVNNLKVSGIAPHVGLRGLTSKRNTYV